MGRYIDYDDVNGRYPSIGKQYDAGIVNSYHIRPVEAELDGIFANHFTVPFSSNNETVKDLAVELVYARIANLKIADTEKLKQAVYDRANRILNEQEYMVTSSGEAIGKIGDTVWSSTEDYAPVFGMGDTYEFEVDSDRLQDEEDARL